MGVSWCMCSCRVSQANAAMRVRIRALEKVVLLGFDSVHHEPTEVDAATFILRMDCYEVSYSDGVSIGRGAWATGLKDWSSDVAWAADLRAKLTENWREYVE
eukprot:14929624-Heterocapsa_arctica.AAC.1